MKREYKRWETLTKKLNFRQKATEIKNENGEGNKKPHIR